MWDVEQFHKMLDASRAFAKLNVDFREQVQPELNVLELESLTDAIEVLIQQSNYDAVIDGLIQGSVLYSHTGYLNQQLNFPVAASTIGALWSSILNQGHAVFSMSPISSVIERRMLDWAKGRLRLPRSAFGLSTGGGSLANLTALIAARNKLDDWHIWKRGGASHSQITVLVSQLAHYSIARSAAMIGIGEENVVAVEVDETGSIDIAKLCSRLEDGGRYIICLTLGTTSSGAFDDLAGFFLRHGVLERDRLWVHVDAAHGGSFYHCAKLSAQFEAIAQSDSVCWDLHKVFFQSLPLSFLFFKSKETANYVSKHCTPYLSQEIEGDYPDMHNWTLECSRSGNAMKLWLSLHNYGEHFFQKNIAHLVDMTDRLYSVLFSDPRIHIYAKPTTNIVCFNFKASDGDSGDVLTKKIFAELNADPAWSVGFVYIVSELFIKICFMNPRIDEGKIKQLYDSIRLLLSAHNFEINEGIAE